MTKESQVSIPHSLFQPLSILFTVILIKKLWKITFLSFPENTLLQYNEDRCYQKDFPNRTKRFSWWYKNILLSVQKHFPNGTKIFYWSYKNILLIVQNHFTNSTKSFYQAVNIKILQIIWENKKRKIKNNNGTNIFKYTFSVDNFKKIISDIRTSVNELLDCMETNATEQTRNRLTIEFNKNAKIILKQKKCWLTISRTNSHYCFKIITILILHLLQNGV